MIRNLFPKASTFWFEKNSGHCPVKKKKSNKGARTLIKDKES